MLEIILIYSVFSNYNVKILYITKVHFRNEQIFTMWRFIYQTNPLLIFTSSMKSILLLWLFYKQRPSKNIYSSILGIYKISEIVTQLWFILVISWFSFFTLFSKHVQLKIQYLYSVASWVKQRRGWTRLRLSVHEQHCTSQIDKGSIIL